MHDSVFLLSVQKCFRSVHVLGHDCLTEYPDKFSKFDKDIVACLIKVDYILKMSACNFSPSNSGIKGFSAQ